MNMTHRLHYLLGLLFFIFYFFSMSEAKTDSPFILTLVLISHLQGHKICWELRARFMCTQEAGEIVEEASVSLRGVGRVGCWKRVEMTNGILCN